jgi:hypothetical protein
MTALRYLLIPLTLAGLIFLAVALDDEIYRRGWPRHSSDQGGLIITGLIVSLVLNATYLVLNRPLNRPARGRLRRLIGLWFDAKEAEFRSRINPP